jgi:hypothetical protein
MPGRYENQQSNQNYDCQNNDEPFFPPGEPHKQFLNLHNILTNIEVEQSNKMAWIVLSELPKGLSQNVLI